MKKLLSLLHGKRKNKKGFTLIEMIVVVAIIAILILLMVPNVMRFIQSTNETAANANAKTIFVAAQTYVTDQYTKGTIITGDGRVEKGDPVYDNYIASPEKVMKGATATYTVVDGAVTKATWSRGSAKGEYPQAVSNSLVPST